MKKQSLREFSALSWWGSRRCGSVCRMWGEQSVMCSFLPFIEKPNGGRWCQDVLEQLLTALFVEPGPHRDRSVCLCPSLEPLLGPQSLLLIRHLTFYWMNDLERTPGRQWVLWAWINWWKQHHLALLVDSRLIFSFLVVISRNLLGYMEKMDLSLVAVDPLVLWC